MDHYHGTPITPESCLDELEGKCFCVSYADPRDVAICHRIGRSVMLDNGAYSFWTRGEAVDWKGFVAWAKPWLLAYPTSWAVMPDVIDGTEEDNRRLSTWLYEYDRDVWRRCAPVWHMHESIRHLRYLCLSRERVCIGSSGAYADPTTAAWRDRMDEAMEEICVGGVPPTKLHMLRAMSQATRGRWPFDSADSTNVARNHHRHPSVRPLVDRIEAHHAPTRFTRAARQLGLLGAGDRTLVVPAPPLVPLEQRICVGRSSVEFRSDVPLPVGTIRLDVSEDAQGFVAERPLIELLASVNGVVPHYAQPVDGILDVRLVDPDVETAEERRWRISHDLTLVGTRTAGTHLEVHCDHATHLDTRQAFRLVRALATIVESPGS